MSSPPSSASASGSTCRSPTSSAALKGDINYGNGRVAKGTKEYMKFWSEHASYPFKSHDTWFVTEDIRWGKFEGDHGHQGAGRQGEPRGPLACRREGPRRRRRGHSGDAPRAARRPSSTARSSIRPTRRPTSRASRSSAWKFDADAGRIARRPASPSRRRNRMNMPLLRSEATAADAGRGDGRAIERRRRAAATFRRRPSRAS